jgi:hypothetical protein
MAPLAASSSSPLQPLDWSCLAASLPRYSLLAALLAATETRCRLAPLTLRTRPQSSTTLHFCSYCLSLSPTRRISQTDQLRRPEITLFLPRAPSPKCSITRFNYSCILPPLPPVFPHAISSFSSFSSFSSLLLTFTPLKHNPRA